MRRDIGRLDDEDFNEALTKLGYTRRVNQAMYSEWRHGRFHLFIRKRPKGRVVLTIHEDRPSRLPPFHKSTHKSKDLEKELDRIYEAYKRKRGL